MPEKIKNKIEIISAILWITLSCILIELQYLLPYIVVMILLLFMTLFMLELIYWCEDYCKIKPFKLSIFIGIIHMVLVIFCFIIVFSIKTQGFFYTLIIALFMGVQAIINDLLIKNLSSIEKIFNMLI